MVPAGELPVVLGVVLSLLRSLAHASIEGNAAAEKPVRPLARWKELRSSSGSQP